VPNVGAHEFGFCAQLAEFGKKFLAFVLSPAGNNNACAFVRKR
jgi:hypothetical protein